MTFYIFDPNLFEEEFGTQENFNTNDLDNLCIAELIEKYSDQIFEAKLYETDSLQLLWDEIKHQIVDYYEDYSRVSERIIEDMFKFIPKTIENADMVLSSYNYILKIEKQEEREMETRIINLQDSQDYLVETNAPAEEIENAIAYRDDLLENNKPISSDFEAIQEYLMDKGYIFSEIGYVNEIESYSW